MTNPKDSLIDKIKAQAFEVEYLGEGMLEVISLHNALEIIRNHPVPDVACPSCQHDKFCKVDGMLKCYKCGCQWYLEEIAIAMNIGDASARKDEDGIAPIATVSAETDPRTTSPNLQRREISVVDYEKQARIEVEIALAGVLSGIGYEMGINAVMNRIRPYLSTTKPIFTKEYVNALVKQRFADGKRLGILETEDKLQKPAVDDILSDSRREACLLTCVRFEETMEAKLKGISDLAETISGILWKIIQEKAALKKAPKPVKDFTFGEGYLTEPKPVSVNDVGEIIMSDLQTL